MPQASKRKLKQGAAPAAPAVATGATTEPSTPNKLLLSYLDLRALGISWSRQHLHRLMREGRFPPQVASGPEPSARKFWKAGDIAVWLAALPYAAEPGEAAE